MEKGKGRNREREQFFKLKQIYGLENLLKEFEKHCYTTAIVTINSGDETFQFDLNRSRIGQIRYGYDPFHRPFIQARVLRMLGDYGTIGIIVRSFLTEKHEETGYPYKRIRGYVARLEGNKVTFNMLPVNELYWACTTNATTGGKIPPEREAVYCGPDGIISERARITFLKSGRGEEKGE